MRTGNIEALVLFSGIDRGQIIAVLEFLGAKNFEAGSVLLEEGSERQWTLQTYGTGPPVADRRETAVLVAIGHDEAPRQGSRLICGS